MFKNKKILWIVLVLLILVVSVFYFNNKNIKQENLVNVDSGISKINQPIELCFAKYGKINERGFGDKYTLRMKLDGSNVTGELNLLPAEKDKKVGKFTGTVSPVDKMMMARKTDLWWDTLAEGMNTKEQLKIIFGEGTASIGFGEMTDRGDGVYVYKDAKSILYNLELSDVDCKSLN